MCLGSRIVAIPVTW